jgi:hypothetical protein
LFEEFLLLESGELVCDIGEMLLSGLIESCLIRRSLVLRHLMVHCILLKIEALVGTCLVELDEILLAASLGNILWRGLETRNFVVDKRAEHRSGGIWEIELVLEHPLMLKVSNSSKKDRD